MFIAAHWTNPHFTENEEYSTYEEAHARAVYWEELGYHVIVSVPAWYPMTDSERR